MRNDCPACNPPVGVICAAHCLGEHCRDGVHVDLCVGPGRLRLAEAYRRCGQPAAVVAEVARAERAFNDMMRSW